MYAEFFSREPAAEDRIEGSIAKFARMYHGAHLPEGEPLADISDFLAFPNPWGESSIDSELEREILKDAE